MPSAGQSGPVCRWRLGGGRGTMQEISDAVGYQDTSASPSAYRPRFGV